MSDDRPVEPVAAGRREEWSPGLRRAVDGMPSAVSAHDPSLLLFRVMARCPDLFDRWWGFAEGLLVAGPVGRRIRELLVLQTACVERCGYEFANHALIGTRSGLPAEDIRALAVRDLSGFAPAERIMLEFGFLVASGADAGNDTFADLHTHWSDQEIVAAVYTVNNYRLLSSFCRTLRIRPEAWQAAIAEVLDLPPAVRADLGFPDEQKGGGRDA